MALIYRRSPFLEKTLPGTPPRSVPDVPSQSALMLSEADFKHSGELRLYYGHPALTPKSSTFGLVRKTAQAAGNVFDWHHDGVDIYAPAWPFPHEIPLVAICDGKVEFRFVEAMPDKMGHRVLLFPTGEAGGYFIYGHMSRFEGISGRKVKAGEIIGYVGCSGNADNAAGICSKPNSSYHFSSAHLHLGWKGKDGKSASPLSKLGWSLRFDKPASTDPLEPKPISAKAWKDGGHLLEDPAELPGLRRMMKIVRQALPAATDTAAQPIDDPADRARRIAAADPRAVSTTATCYALAVKRLASTLPASEKKAVQAVVEAELDRSLEALVRLAAEFATHRSRLNEIGAALGPKEEASPEIVAGLIVEAHSILSDVLFHGARALWHAFAGPAIRQVGATKVKSVPGPGAAPDGPFGVNGFSLVYTHGRGVAGLHRSLLLKPGASGPPAPYSAWTYCVGFGRGSGDHTVLDAGILGEAAKTQESNAAASAVRRLVVAQWNLSAHLFRNPPPPTRAGMVRMITGGGATTDATLHRIDALAAAVTGVSVALRALGQHRTAWFAMLAGTGSAALAAAQTALSSADAHVRKAPNNAVVFLQTPPQS